MSSVDRRSGKYSSWNRADRPVQVRAYRAKEPSSDTATDGEITAFQVLRNPIRRNTETYALAHMIRGKGITTVEEQAGGKRKSLTATGLGWKQFREIDTNLHGMNFTRGLVPDEPKQEK